MFAEPRDWPKHLQRFVPAQSLPETARQGVGAWESLEAASSSVAQRSHTRLAPGSLGRAGVEQRDPQWLRQRSHQLSQWHVEHSSGTDEARSSRQLSILTANMGALERLGVSNTGVQSESLVQAYLSGKFHLLLLQEATSEDFRRTLRTYQFSFVDAEDNSLLVALGGTGQHHLEVLRAGHIQNELVTNPRKWEMEKLHCLIVRVGWKDSEGLFVNRAGRGTWVACTLHIHNDLAKKHGAMEPVARQFWDIALDAGVTFVDGDFNRGLKPMQDMLDQALARRVANLQPIYHNTPEGDCIHVITLLPEDSGLVARQTPPEVQPRDLRLRENDLDWHRPCIIHWTNTKESRRAGRARAPVAEAKGAAPAPVGRQH